MSRPILVTRARATAETQMAVFKWINGSLIKVGSDFGTDSPVVASSPARMHNSAVHWCGDLYCNGQNFLHKYDVVNSGEWGEIVEYLSGIEPATLGAAGMRSALMLPVDIDDDPFLIFPITNNSDNHIFVRVSSSGTIEFPAAVVSNPTSHNDNNDRPYNSAVIFQNKYIWWSQDQGGSQTTVYTYDPVNNSISTSIGDTDANRGLDICPFGNQMYVCAANGSVSDFPYLFRVEGSNIVTLDELIPILWRGNNFGRPTLFTDGTDMFAFVHTDGTQDGWEAIKIQVTPTGNITSLITNPVIPAQLRRNNGSTTIDPASRWDSFVDIENDEIYLFFSADQDEGTSVSQYRWKGDSAAMEFLGAGGDGFQFAIPQSKIGGGHRTWSGSGELNAKLQGATVNQTTIDLNYAIDGGSGQAVNVQWFFNPDQETPKQICTLQSTSEGVLILGNTTASGVIADGLLKQVVWAAVADGITPAQSPKVIARIFE